MRYLVHLLCVSALVITTGGCDEQVAEAESCGEAGICEDAFVEEGCDLCIGYCCEHDCEDPETFPFIIITDTTAAANENTNGTPGVDICSVASTCGTAIAATLNIGTGDFCETDGPDCQANRANPNAALQFEDPCEAASDPSHYVALGMGGQLTIEFDADQAGCTLTIVEFEGSDPELYSVQACIDANLTSCLTDANGSTEFARDLTGTQDIQVPTPPEE